MIKAKINGSIQGMSIAKAYLNTLVQLARVDGVVVQEEIDLINKIGKANDMSENEITQCFDDPTDIGSFADLTDDEKFDFIYGIVQLMKVDGRLYKDEIKFCTKMVSKLGYKDDVLFELILKIDSDPDLNADRDSLKKEVQTYLK